MTVTMAGHTFWSSLIFSVLLLSPGFILQKSGTSTITFTHEHWTAEIGAGGPGFLSFEAFHSFCGFQSLCFTEHDICISVSLCVQEKYVKGIVSKEMVE